LRLYSQEERIWLIEQVKYSLNAQVGEEGGFTEYNDEDADYKVAELRAITDAVFRYFDRRI
jgi:hypothetical protein